MNLFDMMGQNITFERVNDGGFAANGGWHNVSPAVKTFLSARGAWAAGTTIMVEEVKDFRGKPQVSRAQLVGSGSGASQGQQRGYQPRQGSGAQGGSNQAAKKTGAGPAGVGMVFNQVVSAYLAGNLQESEVLPTIVELYNLSVAMNQCDSQQGSMDAILRFPFKGVSSEMVSSAPAQAQQVQTAQAHVHQQAPAQEATYIPQQPQQQQQVVETPFNDPLPDNFTAPANANLMPWEQ